MKKAIVITTFVTILLLMSNKAFSNIVDNQQNRGCDPDGLGCGSFGASRGTRKHQGLDIKVAPGQQIKSPISGTVTKHPYPYASDLSFTGIDIKNTEYFVRIFYVKPIIAVGKTVKQEQVIAIAQNIAAKYSSKMTNHAHVEVYKNVSEKWVLIDPTPLFKK